MQSSDLAPVALFTYRRPSHLARTLKALSINPEAPRTKLRIFSDAAKDEAAQADVEQVRAMLRDVRGFGEVEVVFRDRNFGLGANIVGGVTDTLSLCDRVIVLEDDLVVSSHFLRFMNDALSCYVDEPQVGSVSGYSYPLQNNCGETYFIRGADCWGWATWRDRWRHFEPDGRKLLRQLRDSSLTSMFDFDGAMAYTQMLEDQIAGRNDSWAVRWHASCFLRGLLILYPGRSLVQNIGNDGSGTHSHAADTTFDVDISASPIGVGDIAIRESREASEAIKAFFASGASPRASTDLLEEHRLPQSMWRRVRARAKRLALLVGRRALPPQHRPDGR